MVGLISHWGIWIKAKKTWLVDSSGVIVWSSSKAVMDAQVATDAQLTSDREAGNLEVREFKPATEIILEATSTR
jgi:hypothetical protein